MKPNQLFDSLAEYHDYLHQIGQQLPPDEACTVQSECDDLEPEPVEEDFKEVDEFYTYLPEPWPWALLG